MIDCFKEHGFKKPEWEGTIDKCNSTTYFGTVEGNIDVIFLKDGNCFKVDETTISRATQYNLKLIKQPWYSECKFPILVVEISSGNVIKATELINTTLVLEGYTDIVSKYRPATAEDLQSMLYEEDSNTVTSEWRVPSIEELLTLVDYTEYNPASKENIKPEGYWSSTTNVNNSDHAWYVHFNNGGTDYVYKSYSRNVRCCRNTSMGLEWSVDSKDELTWEEAFEYASELNKG